MTTKPASVDDSNRTRRGAGWRRLVTPAGVFVRDPRDGHGSPFAILRRRLVITNVVVVTVVLAALCTMFYAFEANVTRMQVDQQLAAEARHEAAMGLPQPTTVGSAETAYVPGSPNLFSIVLAEPHRILQDEDQVTRYGLPDWASAREVLAGTQPSASASVTRDGVSYRLYTVPIRSGTGIVGAVQTGTSLTVYDDHLRSLLLILVLLSACVLLLTTILSISLAERALTPARQAFARQRQFATAASHELRTPLAFIRSQAELIASADTAPAATGEITSDARDIVQEVDYLARMTRDLLLLARDERDPRALTLKSVDLRAIMRDVATTALPLAQERGVRLIVETDGTNGDPLTVWGDADRLRQLVLVLLDNGVRYTPSGGTVSLGVRTERGTRLGSQHAGTAVLTVRDTGIGIAPSELPRIFEPFYRASAPHPHPREEGGTGLGLALAQWIAHAHGGTITVHSTPGQGSVFTVVLPLRPTHSREHGG